MVEGEEPAEERPGNEEEEIKDGDSHGSQIFTLVTAIAILTSVDIYCDCAQNGYQEVQKQCHPGICRRGGGGVKVCCYCVNAMRALYHK